MTRIDRTLVLLLLSNALASVGVGVAMIAVPWILASQIEGGMLFGILITAANVALAILAPWTGVLIDSTDRKTFMVRLRMAFALGLALVVILELAFPGSLASLVIYYLLGASFYAINIPLRTAFVQELYRDSEYARVNSILEIENQVAAVITGALAIILIDWVGLTAIATINAFLLLGATVCIAMILHRPSTTIIERRTPLQDIFDGWAIMRRERALSIVLLVATLPYVVVILYTYLHPVALSQLLKLDGSQYALVEVLFAMGAIAGGTGLLVWRIATDRIIPTIRLLVGLFALVALLQAALPVHFAFLAIASLFGALNAAVRILRQTLLMQEAEPREIGRIGAFVQCWIMTLRAVFLGLAAATVSGIGIVPALWICALLPVAGWLVLRLHAPLTMKRFPEPKEALT